MIFMWWFLKKTADDKGKIIYAYGRETKEVSGKVLFNKISEEFSVIKIADGDTKKSVNKLLPHIYRIITKENSPNERQIAIG